MFSKSKIKVNRIEFTDEDNCVECDEAIEGLEKIDDETDALDITMVKVNDARYAKKYGVNKMPALVYFRRKFPSIYRDNLFDEDTILLNGEEGPSQSTRFRQCLAEGSLSRICNYPSLSFLYLA